jgi:hypothetical protein
MLNNDEILLLMAAGAVVRQSTAARKAEGKA